ncbi:hypothetical protein M9H77_22469 [Catharanthus roseus]|uniref:Uncharacterized protein n=1 Tax=Catharanthus roseus TaxID=4058 RepID=A0ACC0AQY8_CATRO|nr:hypothetical protein M9H77_22469 [Catharanthus roseus]
MAIPPKPTPKISSSLIPIGVEYYLTPNSLPSSCGPNSSVLQCTIPLLLPKNSLCSNEMNFSTNYKVQESGFLPFAAASSSATKPSNGIAPNVVRIFQETTPNYRVDLAEKTNDPTIMIHKRPHFSESNTGLQFQDLSASERTKILEKIEKHGGFSNLSAYCLSPDYSTYSVLISFYCKKNDPVVAKCVLDHMLEQGFQPDVATFTTLINSFCKNGKLQNAFKVFDIMTKSGCEPTVNTYNCLLKGLCYVGKVEEAYQLLSNIKKSSKKPDIYTYTAVMNGFCKVGRSDEALELLDEAIEMGLIPNVVSYNTLFNGYFKEGRPLDGIGLLRKMKERNCSPDHVSYSTLLHGLLKWGKTGAALPIYKEMMKNGFELDERMMNALLRALCRRSRKEKKLLNDANDLLERMRNRGCPVYSSTQNLVIKAFSRGNYKKDQLEAWIQ